MTRSEVTSCSGGSSSGVWGCGTPRILSASPGGASNRLTPISGDPALLQWLHQRGLPQTDVDKIVAEDMAAEDMLFHATRDDIKRFNFSFGVELRLWRYLDEHRSGSSPSLPSLHAPPAFAPLPQQGPSSPASHRAPPPFVNGPSLNNGSFEPAPANAPPCINGGDVNRNYSSNSISNAVISLNTTPADHIVASTAPSSVALTANSVVAVTTVACSSALATATSSLNKSLTSAKARFTATLNMPPYNRSRSAQPCPFIYPTPGAGGGLHSLSKSQSASIVASDAASNCSLLAISKSSSSGGAFGAGLFGASIVNSNSTSSSSVNNTAEATLIKNYDGATPMDNNPSAENVAKTSNQINNANLDTNNSSSELSPLDNVAVSKVIIESASNGNNTSPGAEEPVATVTPFSNKSSSSGHTASGSSGPSGRSSLSRTPLPSRGGPDGATRTSAAGRSGSALPPRFMRPGQRARTFTGDSKRSN